MKTTNNIIENLILKLELSKEIYKQASDKVHNEAMTKEFKTLHLLRSDFQNRLAALVDIDLNDASLSFSEKLRLETIKLGMNIDHLYLRRNEKEILGLIIANESGLLSEYSETVEKFSNKKHIVKEISSQNEIIKQNMIMLKHEYDGYIYA